MCVCVCVGARQGEAMLERVPHCLCCWDRDPTLRPGLSVLDNDKGQHGNGMACTWLWQSEPQQHHMVGLPTDHRSHPDPNAVRPSPFRHVYLHHDARVVYMLHTVVSERFIPQSMIVIFPLIFYILYIYI